MIIQYSQPTLIVSMPLAEPPGIDVRAVLAAWVERMRADARFAGWEVVYKGAGDWPGAAAVVDVDGAGVLATLCAWPTGSVDLDAVRISDERVAQRHEEVPTVDALVQMLATLEESLLSLEAGP